MITGLLFGSFDPIHIGHISLVTQALNSKLVDRVLLVPAWHNPWKKHNPANFNDRCNMCMTAIRYIHNANVSLIEAYKLESTFDVINAFKKFEDTFKIITTPETFNTIPDWKHGKELIASNKFILIGSDNFDSKIIIDSYSKGLLQFIEETNHLNICSTVVREMIKENKIIVPWVPAEVSEYIKQHNLYTD